MSQRINKPKCFCEDYNLHDGSRMYIHMPLDFVSGIEDGIAFIERIIKYCPCCGKELPKDDEIEPERI